MSRSGPSSDLLVTRYSQVGGWEMLKTSVVSRYTIVAALFITMIPWGVAAQGVANYRAVSDQRLGNPSTPHWLVYRGTYDGWGFHPADLINTTNVKQLVPLWRFSTGESGWHQATPVVNAGVMFITTPRNQVVALNAFNGDLLWRYTRQIPADILPPDRRGGCHSHRRAASLGPEEHAKSLDADLRVSHLGSGVSHGRRIGVYGRHA
jgi:alcohol dehydrogenase (cytochrome c)